MGKDYSSGMEIASGQRLRELPGPLLITGHTGFKGTWMTFLLEHLEVPVVGYSLEPEKDSLFDRAKRTGAIPEIFADIRDYEALEKFIDKHKPSTIIHMAAQPLVLKSYENPRETFDVNVMGTVNVLDIAFKKEFVKAIIVVTTDKVYRNDNSGRAFVETDPLEGKDPYSASKVGTEAVVAAWQQIAKVSGGPKVASVRAGNVIGGGDYAENRLFADLARAVLNDSIIRIRNKNSSRPWQHVLDPLNGYLELLVKLIHSHLSGSYNFGPTENSITVGNIIDHLEIQYPRLLKIEYMRVESEYEAMKLELNVKKSEIDFGWKPKWNQLLAINRSVEWWINYKIHGNATDLVVGDILDFFE